jgi:hypothetical protein
MLHTTQPRASESRKPIPWARHIFVALRFFIIIAALVAWFSNLPRVVTPSAVEPRLELSLSGAVGTNLVLDAEETAQALSCEQNTIRFLQTPTELYGLSWSFTMPQMPSNASVFTLGGTYPLTLSLVSDAGPYRTFSVTEGELSFDPESKRGYFTAFLYDENGERVFASAAWQCR